MGIKAFRNISRSRIVVKYRDQFQIPSESSTQFSCSLDLDSKSHSSSSTSDGASQRAGHLCSTSCSSNRLLLLNPKFMSPRVIHRQAGSSRSFCTRYLYVGISSSGLLNFWHLLSHTPLLLHHTACMPRTKPKNKRTRRKLSQR